MFKINWNSVHSFNAVEWHGKFQVVGNRPLLILNSHLVVQFLIYGGDTTLPVLYTIPNMQSQMGRYFS
jgi:hypothetical protein